MTLNEFIFSDKTSYRLSRHFALWIIFSLYFFVVNFIPTSGHDFAVWKTYLSAIQKLIYVPISIFSVYISIYFLLPRYILKEKYFRFFILFVCLCSINLITAYFLTKLLVLFTDRTPFKQLPIQITIFQPVIYGLGLSLAASGFAIIIKLLKIRYLKQKENEWLEKQMITTELQMIKTHFHPHFLSDALQNISYLIRRRSKESSEAILKLADLLSYILYDNEKERVLLKHELLMVREYLELEKIFYGDRIIINFKEKTETDNIYIAPLIIVTLVQHCCEQSLLSLQQKLMIDIEIKAEEKQLLFRLSCNGYYENINGVPQQNSSLNQVLKRVQVLYPGKHRMETHLENGVFSLLIVLYSEGLPSKAIDTLQKNVSFEPA